MITASTKMMHFEPWLKLETRLLEVLGLIMAGG